MDICHGILLLINVSLMPSNKYLIIFRGVYLFIMHVCTANSMYVSGAEKSELITDMYLFFNI